MSDQLLKSDPDQETVVQSRRRLLKAAVATAPLIATLPNGAAWATASTAQCIIASRDASKDNPDIHFDARGSLDSFVRMVGRQTEFKEKNGPRRKVVYSFPPNYSPYYDVSGVVFEPEGWRVLNKSEQTVYLLRVFVPRDDNGTPSSDPTTVTDCTFLSGPSHSIPPQCIFPVGQRDFSSDFGNMGLTVSCLCSVNPTLVTGACAVQPA